MTFVPAGPGNTVTAVLSNPSFIDFPNMAFNPVVADTHTVAGTMLLQVSLLLQAYELLQVALLFRPTSLSEIHNVALSLLLKAPLQL